jgi:hypothetical protein
MPDNKKQPIVFISYSHLDEPDEFLHPGETRWLSYVSSHLKPAAAHGKLERWDDRRIDGGGIGVERSTMLLNAAPFVFF